MRAAAMLAVLALPAWAEAGGFAVSEQSALSAGTGGAGTARAEADAAWLNPAALTDGGGVRLALGISLARPSLSAEGMDESWQTDSETGVSTPPHLHASYATGRLAFGLYAGVPFGGGVTWPEEWAGRHEVVSSRLEVFRVAPFVAWRRGRLAASGGLHLDAGRMRLRRGLDFVDAEGDVRIDLRGTGVGAHASLALAARPDLALGLAYKSRTRLPLAGEADFETPPEFAMRTPDQRATTTLTLPDRFVLGAAWTRGPYAAVADLELTLWSVNQRTVIDFAEEATPSAVQENRWRTTLALRGGGERRFGDRWRARAGAFYDPTPAPRDRLAPSSPDATRLGLTGGGSVDAGAGVTVDAFYELMHLLDRQAENPDALAARYGGTAHIVGVGVRLTR